MKGLSAFLSSWSQFFFAPCCQSIASRTEDKSHGRSHGPRNTFTIIHEQPSFIPPPSAAPSRPTGDLMRDGPGPRKRSGSGWSSFSARKRLLSSHSSQSRRPQISKPTNFRHVNSESFHFPAGRELSTNIRPSSFQPLELNIRQSDIRLSPIIPSMDFPSPPVTPPPRAYTASIPSGDSPAVSHQQSFSSLSFHVPRRPVNVNSVFDSPGSDASIIQRPQPTRIRGYTASSSSTTQSPIMEDLVARVANAMMERDRLQDQIEDIIERQSIYISSRPSTAYGQPEMEPMPEIPALPPNAPSFSERLGSDPAQSAPTKQSARASYRANSSRKIEGRAPPPPLPLRLRPPLRKKKSFSRVSSWLFPAGAEHKRDISLESLTNAPGPVSGRGVFYEVAHPGSDGGGRSSFDSKSSTVSDWTVEEEEETIPTSLSPSSAAAATPRTLAGPIKRSPQLVWRENPFHSQQRKSVVGVAC
ncbi:hypothetical protein F5Y17DRAFT_421716 [Xylariaceae sp. FL0594]|nr:hypothetical protein F5Y17DRAFT_421716 [Xylariaceae sp. FL0594]